MNAAPLQFAALALLAFAVSRAGEGDEVEAAPGPAQVAIRYRLVPQEEIERVRFTALVPSSAESQQVVEAVEYAPDPTEVFEKDGQRYARFDLPLGTESATVEIKVTLRLARSDLETARARGEKTHAREPDDRKRWTRREPHLECDDLAIRALSAKVVGQGDLERIDSALRLVVDRLEPGAYDPENLGAREALRRGRGDCTEYSDLLVAVLRADGIPSRRAYGFLLDWSTTPKHDWVEVRTERYGWITLDPLFVERGAATLEKSKASYVRLSTLRNDETLRGYHYFAFDAGGKKLDVEDEFVVLERGGR